MRPLRDETKALDRLKIESQWESEPALTETELLYLLEKHQIAEIWTPETIVFPGQVIAPTSRTGYLYEVVLERDQDGAPGGVTGAVEPRWPLDPRWASWEPRIVEDGTARFRIHRREIIGLWDVMSAVHDALMLHATKASEKFSSSLEGNSFHPEQMAEAWLRRAALSRPMRIS